MLTVLGLGAAEEIVYRQLVSCARATAADLAAATGQPVEAVSATLDRLVERGLAVADPAGTVDRRAAGRRARRARPPGRRRPA